METQTLNQPVEILLVEDNEADVRLTKEGIREAKIHNNLNIVRDGEEAMQYLKNEPKYKHVPRPDLILLDLNLPKKDGREVLQEIKKDEKLRHIPVIVFTTSQAEQDIVKSYNLHANCYVVKPLNLDQFTKVVRSIEDFWFSIVSLPNTKDQQ